MPVPIPAASRPGLTGSTLFPKESIMSRAASGTSNFATFNVIPPALDFHQSLGPRHKEARLRHLRNRWVGAVEDIPALEILTPNDDDMVCAITSFRIKGKGSADDNRAIVRRLLEQYNIATVWRDGVAKGDCIRVTPAIYNSVADMDRFAEALREIAQS